MSANLRQAFKAIQTTIGSGSNVLFTTNDPSCRVIAHIVSNTNNVCSFEYIHSKISAGKNFSNADVNVYVRNSSGTYTVFSDSFKNTNVKLEVSYGTLSSIASNENLTFNELTDTTVTLTHASGTEQDTIVAPVKFDSVSIGNVNSATTTSTEVIADHINLNTINTKDNNYITVKANNTHFKNASANDDNYSSITVGSVNNISISQSGISNRGITLTSLATNGASIIMDSVANATTNLVSGTMMTTDTEQNITNNKRLCNHPGPIIQGQDPVLVPSYIYLSPLLTVGTSDYYISSSGGASFNSLLVDNVARISGKILGDSTDHKLFIGKDSRTNPEPVNVNLLGNINGISFNAASDILLSSQWYDENDNLESEAAIRMAPIEDSKINTNSDYTAELVPGTMMTTDTSQEVNKRISDGSITFGERSDCVEVVEDEADNYRGRLNFYKVNTEKLGGFDDSGEGSITLISDIQNTYGDARTINLCRAGSDLNSYTDYTINSQLFVGKVKCGSINNVYIQDNIIPSASGIYLWNRSSATDSHDYSFIKLNSALTVGTSSSIADATFNTNLGSGYKGAVELYARGTRSDFSGSSNTWGNFSILTIIGGIELDPEGPVTQVVKFNGSSIFAAGDYSSVPTSGSETITAAGNTFNVVTRNTAQSITGKKTFNAELQIKTGNNITTDSSSTSTIGTSSAPFSKVYAADFYSTSDRRLKENIKDSNIPFEDIINKLSIKDYYFKSDTNHERLSTGLIAQELRDALPEEYRNFFISGEETNDSYLSINDPKMVYIVIGALKKEIEKRQDLEKRLERLEKLLSKEE